MNENYYIVVVPDSGPSRCYHCHDELDDLVAVLKEEIAEGDRALYVFRGERIHLSNAPRHLLLPDQAIPLFEPPADLKPADSEFIASDNWPSPFIAVAEQPAPAPPATEDPWDEDEFEDED